MSPGSQLRAQMDWYRRSMKLHGAVVADVGANVGHLSQFFWNQGDGETRVVSIEPMPQNLEALRRRAEAADDPRWTVEPCAVSGTEGTLWLEAAHDAEFGYNAAVRSAGAGLGRFEVRCEPLSRLVPDATIVKLDVEGHEYEVLDEALEAMPRVQVWAVEFHRVAGRPLADALGAFDRSGFDLVAAGQRPADRGDGAARWHDMAIPPTLEWDQIPVAKRHADGSEFKMLHVMATRRGSYLMPEVRSGVPGSHFPS